MKKSTEIKTSKSVEQTAYITSELKLTLTESFVDGELTNTEWEIYLPSGGLYGNQVQLTQSQFDELVKYIKAHY